MTDQGLKQSVLDELIWEPSVDGAHIGVARRAGNHQSPKNASVPSQLNESAEHLHGTGVFPSMTFQK